MSEEGQQPKLPVYQYIEDMVDQFPPVPDTPIVGSQKVWFRELIHMASTPMVG